MICGNCSNELPEGSDFCPYCMTKFDESPPSEPIKERSSDGGKKVIIMLAVLVVAFVVVAAIFIPKLGKKKPEIDVVANAPETSDTKSTAPEAQSSASTSSTAKKIEKSSDENDEAIIKQLMISAFMSLLDDKFFNAEVYDHSCLYTVYDLNSDGIYELIINTGVGSGEYDSYLGTEIYTFRNNKIVCLGKIEGWGNDLWEFHVAKDGGVLLYGEKYLLQINLSGKSVVYNYLPEEELHDYSLEMMPQSGSLGYLENGNSLFEEVLNRGYSAVQKEYAEEWYSSVD